MLMLQIRLSNTKKVLESRNYYFRDSWKSDICAGARLSEKAIVTTLVVYSSKPPGEILLRATSFFTITAFSPRIKVLAVGGFKFRLQ